MSFHSRRVWTITPVTQSMLRRFLADRPTDHTTAQLLGHFLVEHTSSLRAGFVFGSYYFLNDSDSTDGEQTYAVVDNRTLDRIDSVTFSGMKPWQAWEYIEDLLDNSRGLDEFPSLGKINERQLRSVHHRRCTVCQAVP